jgi:hypothetical protein
MKEKIAVLAGCNKSSDKRIIFNLKKTTMNAHPNLKRQVTA